MYEPATGRFSSLDPFFGNLNDPQSLHKYLFVHGDPVNSVDPTGQYSSPAVGAVGSMLMASFRAGPLVDIHEWPQEGGGTGPQGQWTRSTNGIYRNYTARERAVLEYFMRAVFEHSDNAPKLFESLSNVIPSVRIWHMDLVRSFSPKVIGARIAIGLGYKAVSVGMDQYYQLRKNPDVEENLPLIAHELFHSWESDLNGGWLPYFGKYSIEYGITRLDTGDGYKNHLSEVFAHAIEHTFSEMLNDKAFRDAYRFDTIQSLPESMKRKIQVTFAKHNKDGLDKLPNTIPIWPDPGPLPPTP